MSDQQYNYSAGVEFLWRFFDRVKKYRELHPNWRWPKDCTLLFVHGEVAMSTEDSIVRALLKEALNA